MVFFIQLLVGSQEATRVTVRVIRTDEELIIARACAAQLAKS
jgi:acetate kinase